MVMEMPLSNIILFDGECNFCDRSVQFIIKKDVEARFRFASIQSEVGKKLVESYNIPNNINSFILIIEDSCYFKSSAALMITKEFKGLWGMLSYLSIIPVPLRDCVYNIIAKNRYKWFGKKEQCMVPSPEIRKRFLL